MPTDRRRLLELALEALEHHRDELGREIAEISSRLGRRGDTPVIEPEAARRRPRFSKAERARRSARLKALWETRWKKRRA